MMEERKSTCGGQGDLLRFQGSSDASCSNRQESILKLFLCFHETSLKEKSWSSVREQLQALRAEAHEMGFSGTSAFGALTDLGQHLRIDQLNARQFSVFYRFVFLVSRQFEHKGLSKESAIQAWQLFCHSRLKFLTQWCHFIRGHRHKFITEDTWMQLLEFDCAIATNFYNYDPAGAWPTLMDEFVDHVKESGTTPRPGISAMGGSDQNGSMCGVCGSEGRPKRALIDVEAMAHKMKRAKINETFY